MNWVFTLEERKLECYFVLIRLKQFVVKCEEISLQTICSKSFWLCHHLCKTTKTILFPLISSQFWWFRVLVVLLSVFAFLLLRLVFVTTRKYFHFFCSQSIYCAFWLFSDFQKLFYRFIFFSLKTEISVHDSPSHLDSLSVETKSHKQKNLFRIGTPNVKRRICNLYFLRKTDESQSYVFPPRILDQH